MDVRTIIWSLPMREVAAIAEGRARLGDTPAEQVAAWNAAIDRENGYDA